MHGDTCVICDRGNCELSKRGWCFNCEDTFARVFSTINCAAESMTCESPISCMMRKTCVQIRAAIRIVDKGFDAAVNPITESLRLETVRSKLKEKADNGMLGVVSAKARVPEFILRNWVDNSHTTPSRQEVVDIQTALESK